MLRKQEVLTIKGGGVAKATFRALHPLSVATLPEIEVERAVLLRANRLGRNCLAAVGGRHGQRFESRGLEVEI